jgi:3-methyladenine DNA glycosylase AlkD
MVDDPAAVTEHQMDAWAADFDSWDLCDQVCGSLFDRTPFVEEKIRQWAEDERQFVRRAAFALIAEHAVHAKAVPDATFLPYLELIERHATDPRNFVKKAVNWALRQIGKRNPALNADAIAYAERIGARGTRSARWIASDALRELRGPLVARKLSRR